MSPTEGPAANRLFEIFFELVRIDSVSGFEGAVCAYIKHFCNRLGFAVHEDGAAAETGGECGNLVVRVPAGAFSPLAPVILCAHMDTVEPGRHVLPLDMGDHFVSMSETVLGADCKAGVAAILASVEALVGSGGSYRALELMFTVQEEPGLVGSRHLDMSLVDGEWGVVLDGSGPVGGIVVEAPSQVRLKLTVKGRAAHAGVEPEKGANAIACAASAVAGIRIGRLDETTTSNIGLISGGVAVNIVPELAVVEGEVRSMSDERLDAEGKLVVESFERSAAEWGCTLETQVERSFEHFKLDAASRSVRELARALADCGFEPSLERSGGGSDANVLNAAGLDLTVMNIGLVNAHSKEELIKKDELQGVARVITRLAYAAAEEGMESKS
jgi:tripeptide aminopeptidase